MAAKHKKKFLGITEASKILDVSRATVWQRIKNNELEAIRVGKVYRIPRDAFDEYTSKPAFTQNKKE